MHPAGTGRDYLQIQKSGKLEEFFAVECWRPSRPGCATISLLPFTRFPSNARHTLCSPNVIMSPMNAASADATTSAPASRYVLIACAVVALHIGLIWLLQGGLLMRTAQQVVLVEVLTRLIDPPAPVVAPAPIEPPKAVPLTPRPPPPRPRAAAEPLVVPALPVSPAVPDAPTATTAPPVQAAPMAAAPATAVPSTQPAQPSPPPIQLPSSDADTCKTRRRLILRSASDSTNRARRLSRF